MSNPFGNKIWYGRLGSDADSPIVIYDPKIPSSSSKAVCLYNTSREKIVEYVADILRPNVVEISSDELPSIKKQYDKAFKKAQNDFFSHSNLKTTVNAKAKPTPTNTNTDFDNDIDDDVDDDDDFDAPFDD